MWCPNVVGISLVTVLLSGVALPAAQVATATKRPIVATRLVAFVGCESDGQLGPSRAPTGRSKPIAIPLKVAQRLAYYKTAEGLGTLAPKGWHCFGTSGSSGRSLYVTPDPIITKNLFSTDWKGFEGPAISISYNYGGTSGRFAVAETTARVFPAHKAFVERVVAEGFEPAGSYVFTPYPVDILNYRSKNIVEFVTPARSEGLGTTFRLQKSDAPITGAAILVGEEPDLVSLAVRLPAEMSDLAPFITRETEEEIAGRGH